MIIPVKSICTLTYEYLLYIFHQLNIIIISDSSTLAIIPEEVEKERLASPSLGVVKV